MSRILFVYPPSTMISDVNAGFSFNICLGSAYCISYLVQAGIDAEPFLSADPLNVRECVTQILARQPQVVGFTVYDSNYCSCQLIASYLKKAAPAMVIVFGGPTASVQAKTILERNDFVDICVRHEGEETCLELLTVLEETGYSCKKAAENGALEKIKGISYRRDRLIHENPDRNILLTNRHVGDFLDKYPSPYLSGLVTSHSLGILTSRGCNQHCTYCNCAAISKRAIATHSVDRVTAELDYISRRMNVPDGEAVDIFDDAFTLLPGRALEICRQLIANRIHISLSCSTRCDKVDEELLDTMKEAGFQSISFSLESATPRLLRIIGKVRAPSAAVDPDFEKETQFIEKLRKYSAYAKKIGLNVSASIMIGLPTETQAEGQATVDLIRSLGDNLDSYAHNIFQVLPGTPIFLNHEPFGLKLERLDNGIHYKTIHPYNTGGIQPAPGSHLGDFAEKQDRLTIKTLALFPAEKRTTGFFNKIILWHDHISRELVEWLQEILALDGLLLQVYSDLDKVRLHYEENRHNLYRYISPTLFHLAYYQSAVENGVTTLTSLNRHTYGAPLGFAIKLADTRGGFMPAGGESSQTVCLEQEKTDALFLHGFLARLSEKADAVDELFEQSFTPYIAALCRWEKLIPNCSSLETVIVDDQHHIKTCWNGDPIGKVGMSFAELRQNLLDLRKTEESQRDCRNCPKEQECARCIFPTPLSAAEYCGLTRNSRVEKPAELLRAFDFLKEL